MTDLSPPCSCPRSLLPQITDGACRLSREGVIEEINPATLEYLHQDPTGRTIQELFPQWNPDWRSQKEIQGVCFLESKGGLFDLRIITDCPLHDLVLFQDHAYHLEQVKAQILKSHQQFISFLSHEIRNPLQSLTMANQMLKHRNQDPSLQKYLEIMQHSSRDMRKIINDVLDLGKIEAGELSIEEEEIQPQELLQEILSSYQASAEESNLKLIGEVQPENLAPFYSDYTRIVQVVSNLVSNAIKYSNEGEVKLVIYVDAEDRIHLRVTDTGIGIPEKDLNKLFKSRIKLTNKASLKKKFQSEGIGLLISSKIAELLGGQITVTSCPDRGSCFCLQLPYRVQPSLSSSAPEVPTLPTVPLGGKIVIAEDSRSNLELVDDLIQHFNQRYHFQVQTYPVSNGLEALNLFREQGSEIDLFLLDINMDLLDGWQTCQVIKDLDPSRRVVALTGNIYARAKKEKFQEFDEIVLKPCTESKILNLLVRYLPSLPAEITSSS